MLRHIGLQNMNVGVKTNFELLTPSLVGLRENTDTLPRLILCDDCLRIHFIKGHVWYSVKWSSFYCTCFLRLTRGNNSLIDLLLCSMWLCFLKAARARIFFFLKASASICKNSLLVTSGAFFWNTIAFKHPHRAKMNDGLWIRNWARFMTQETFISKWHPPEPLI